MPPVKRTKQSTIKKNASTKRAKTTFTGAMSRSSGTGMYRAVSVPGGFAFPLQLKNTLKYVENVSVAITAGVGGFYLTANGLYTISVGGSAHKPLFFNQLAALYNKYHVVSSVVKLYFITNPVASTETYTMCVTLDDTGSLVSTNGVQERALSSTAVLNGPNNVQRPGAPLVASYSAQKMYGATTLSNTSLQGTSTTNPSDPVYYFVSVLNPVNATTATTYIRAEIMYNVIWSDLKDVDQST